MQPANHIAVLDDEIEITLLLAEYLRSHGFRVSAVNDGPALMDLMASDPADLVLLDLGLPGEDGLSIARRLRERWHCGLMIVTGRGDAVDKVVGLEVGADDYVTKPFDLRELAARAKAVLRRLRPDAAPAQAGLAGSQTLSFCGWTMDLDARRLSNPLGGEIVLTAGEFYLLSVLARHPGRVLSRDFLLSHTRGREAAPFDRAVDVQIGRLRRKIEIDPEHPEYIKSVRGAGYLFAIKVSRA